MVLAAIAVFAMGTQAMTQEAARKRLLLGTELGVSVQTYTDWWGQGEKYRQSAFRFGPQLGIFLTPSIVHCKLNFLVFWEGCFGGRQCALQALEPLHPKAWSTPCLAKK